ncbi:MAG: MerR family transcriptional regulator [Oscillospiraceae bacterium]|nr:MerR family transcriptional regulator [Oscillospiraceae bacterium]
MKINELARMSGVSPETIRKYRDRGLLTPQCNPENGYYEYADADFLNLLYIRKLRGANLSLDAIENTYRNADAASLLEGYRTAIETLEEEIRRLKRREMMLRLSYRHYERDAQAIGKILVVDAFGAKYDGYLDRDKQDPVLRLWVENVDLFTPVICIDRQYFESAQLPEWIPLRVGLGTYEDILRKTGLPLPHDVSVFPEGRYASFFLELEQAHQMPGSSLVPVRDFLREQGLCAVSDSTAYLYRVDLATGTPRFVFCVRVRVEEVDA